MKARDDVVEDVTHPARRKLKIEFAPRRVLEIVHLTEQLIVVIALNPLSGQTGRNAAVGSLEGKPVLMPGTVSRNAEVCGVFQRDKSVQPERGSQVPRVPTPHHRPVSAAGASGGYGPPVIQAAVDYRCGACRVGTGVDHSTPLDRFQSEVVSYSPNLNLGQSRVGLRCIGDKTHVPDYGKIERVAPHQVRSGGLSRGDRAQLVLDYSVGIRSGSCPYAGELE